MSRKSRFCAGCAPRFKSFLREVYKRDVRTAGASPAARDRAAEGKRRRLKTLAVLRGNGPTATPDLARLVGMTARGVREQLKRLGADGLVDCTHEERRHVWEAIRKD
jgi:DNA-binding transcriptional ArsR family regulator